MTETLEQPTPPLPLGARRDRFAPDARLRPVQASGKSCPITTVSGRSGILVTGFDQTRAVHGTGSLSLGEVPPPPGTAAGADPEQLRRRRAGMLLSLDPPDHTRLRRMLMPHFTVRATRALTPRIEQFVQAQVNEFEAAGPGADLVAGFAMPVPSLVICVLLGVPYVDREHFQSRAARLTTAGLPPAERAALSDESVQYMTELTARARRNPGDNLLGHLIREYGDRPPAEGGIDDAELAGVANLLLHAGHDTTANAIAMSVVALLENPAQLTLLLAAIGREDDEFVTHAIEELLRFTSVVSAGFPRIATADTTIGGETIPAGTLVSASLSAANRDPAWAPDLDSLDLARRLPGHVAFGYGIHHCLGAPLARLELRTALVALLKRLPSLRLADPDGEIPFRRDAFIHGVAALPVTW